MSDTELRHAAVRKAREDNPDRKKSPEAWAVYKAEINRIIALYGPGPYWGSGMSAAEIKAERAAAEEAGVLTPRDTTAAETMSLEDLEDAVSSPGSVSPYIILGVIALVIFLIFRKK